MRMEFEVLVFLKKKLKPRKRFSFVVWYPTLTLLFGVQRLIRLSSYKLFRDMKTKLS
jgi:hypothetical protein